MATVTGMTAEGINSLVGPSVVGFEIDDSTGAITIQTQDGQSFAVGNVSTTKSIDDAVSKAYPVGSIFLSMIATDPATQLGVGTWAALGPGRVLVGVDPAQPDFSDSGKTGGEKTHQLNVNELPKHSHTNNHDHAAFDTSGSDGQHSHAPSFSTATGGSASNIPTGSSTFDRNSSAAFNSTDNQSPSAHKHTVDIPAYTGSTGVTGADTAHNNMQPYITCFMWRRTA